MHVALVNRLAGIHRGGGEVYDISLAAALGRAGERTEMITGRPLLAAVRRLPQGQEATYVRSPYLRSLAHRLGRAGWRLFDQDLRWFENGAAKVLSSRKPRPDIVQVTGLPDLALRLESDLGMNVVLLFPGPPSMRHERSIKAMRNVAGVGAVTPYLRENFRQDVHDMSAGVETGLFKPGAPRLRDNLGIPASAPLALFAGRLVPLKNIPLLLEVFAGIRKALPAARLLVAGDGPDRSVLRGAASKAGLTVARSGREGAAVVHVPELPHDRMPSCYSGADLLLLTSVNESFSLVALEAMACGVPVVAPRVGYLPSLVPDGAGGVLYAAGDASACVAFCLDILRDPARRRTMGEAGRKAALERHSWDAVAADFRSLYGRVLSA